MHDKLQVDDLVARYDRVRSSCPPHVVLIAVSKQQPLWKMEALMRERGHMDFGENRLTELKNKMRMLTDHRMRWTHYGQLQSNHWRSLRNLPVRLGAVDSPEILEWSKEKRAERERIPILIQVSLEIRDGRGGMEIAQTENLLNELHKHPLFECQGLMFMPLVERNLADRRKQFVEVHRYFELIKKNYRNKHPLNTLSMGMSDDYEVAIACGSTEVRVGTTIFGPRDQGERL